MKYIVNTITELILNNAPEKDSETMIRVDGFENLAIYEAVARAIKEKLDGTEYSYDIKLAKNKWNMFQNTCSDSTVLQSMKAHNWIASSESITYYRNLHTSNILILMGTEDEEDKGGLMNCYTITSDTLIEALDKNYSKVFMGVEDYFGDDEIKTINKIYSDLFSHIPVDICLLSDMADEAVTSFSTINDFIEFFYSSLPSWGLPYKKAKLPTAKEICKNGNILRLENNFISRQLFKKLSTRQYNKYLDQMEEYEKQGKEYSSSWQGWSDQAIKSYSEFCDVVKEFIRGESVQANKDKLLYTDFSIIEDVLEIKIVGSTTEKKTVVNLKGEPLEVFSRALLNCLCSIQETDEQVCEISFKITLADIVCMYSQTDDTEEQQQLLDTWKNICRHTNGVIEYINKDRTWIANDTDIEISCDPSKMFDPANALQLIKDHRVKAASANKSINCITFTAEFKDDNGNIINLYSGSRPRPFVQDFKWSFGANSGWLQSFSDICELECLDNIDAKLVPVATLKKITPLMFAKSEEEFFDLYSESDIKFDNNILDYLDQKCTTDEGKIISAKFDLLGQKYVKFIKSVADNGIYMTFVKNSNYLVDFLGEYQKLGAFLVSQALPGNLKWLLDVYIHAFNIEEDLSIAQGSKDARCCVVPAWHPATLEKINDQKIFILDGCEEWWNSQLEEAKPSRKMAGDTLDNLLEMGMIQSSLDIFPSSGMVYFGAITSYGAFSVYGRSDIENDNKLKELIHKDAIFDDDFDTKENAKMTDNAKMIYGVLVDYDKAFPDAYSNLSIAFVNPSELQPIIASVYKYVTENRKKHPNSKMDITIKVLVKPENKGGKNYLSYWMDECFAEDENVTIHTYLNEWSQKSDLDKLLNGNNDIAFVMDLLKVNSLHFIRESKSDALEPDQCRFPIVFKPSPVSDTSENIKRQIELSQPQFRSSYKHTQVVRYRNNTENIPTEDYIAVREVEISSEGQSIVSSLHEKAYWVVCVDSGMDGALLRNDDNHKDDYSIIGFSTGKGAYGQYNLTVTARKSILTTINHKLENRLYQLFKWDSQRIHDAAKLCINEAGGLDGISLLSAINPKDHNINEFMAYVLTSRREKEASCDAALKIVVHIDSYKHWFSGDLEKLESDSQSRPDFLVLEANTTDSDNLKLTATIVECKIASINNASSHKGKALGQVKHGISVLEQIFDPKSNSIKRRYWYAQLYRALAFAQVTFSDSSPEFAKTASQLRQILEGKFSIDWHGKILGYWLDMQGDGEMLEVIDDIQVYDIPQKRIQKLLLSSTDDVDYVDVSEEVLNSYEDETVDKYAQSNRIKDYWRELVQEKTKTKEQKEPKEEPVIVSEPEPEKPIVEVVSIDDEFEDNTETTDKLQNETVVTNPVIEEQAQDEKKVINLEDARVLIGVDRNNNDVCWEFGHSQMANRHLLITGTSGQGKTYSIQTMLYELSKSNISSVIFDYTEGFRLDQLEGPFKELLGNRIRQRVVKFEKVPVNPFKRQFIEFAGTKFPEKDADVASRFANILTHVYKFGEQQQAAIFEAVRLGMEKYQDSMNMVHFKEELENVKESNKTAQTVISKMTPFFHSIEFEEDNDFDWSNIIYQDEAYTNIFQLTAIDRDMQVIITELMLWDLWYFSTKFGKKEKPFVVVLDEAQNLSHKDKSPSCKILTEGRKFGWSAWYATQSLKVLDDDEVTRLMQSAFKLYFKPTDDEMQKVSKQLDPTDGNLWLSSLKALKKGQCIAVGDRIRPDGKFAQSTPTVTSVSPFEER